jgi:hypothetical protein
LWGRYRAEWNTRSGGYGPWVLQQTFWMGDCSAPPGFGNGGMGGPLEGDGSADGGGSQQQEDPNCAQDPEWCTRAPVTQLLRVQGLHIMTGYSLTEHAETCGKGESEHFRSREVIRFQTSLWGPG